MKTFVVEDPQGNFEPLEILTWNKGIAECAARDFLGKNGCPYTGTIKVRQLDEVEADNETK